MKPAHKRAAIGASAAVMAATAAFVAPWEGLFTRPYRDMVGVVTVCYGETEGVKMTDAPRTPEQCRDMLAAKLPRYYSEIAACWGPEAETVLTDNMRIAFTSSGYNFGAGAFCRSSMVREIKAATKENGPLRIEHLRASCHALRLYNRAGGKVVKGLDNRRRAEEKLCLEGL